MTTATRLFNILIGMGVKLWIAIDNGLCWNSFEGVVSNELLKKMAAYKAEIIAIIKDEQNKYIEQKIDTIISDDCLHALRQMPTDSVDLVCTDPPYGLGFMNKKWDKKVPPIEIWLEVYRVLKPGAFAFVMCSPRQDSIGNMISMLAGAGFETNFTSIFWTYAAGFPKIHNISKAIDKKAGAVREVLAVKERKNDFYQSLFGDQSSGKNAKASSQIIKLPVTMPATEAAKRFAGAYGGFQPKSSIEVILIVMKPRSEATIVDQALANGKGVTWLDDGRIPYQEGEAVPTRDFRKQRSYTSGQVPGSRGEFFIGDPRGRFPGNLLVSDLVLDTENTGDKGYSRYFSLDLWADKLMERLPEQARSTLPFLIVPRPSRAEKERGLENFEDQVVSDGRQIPNGTSFPQGETKRHNTHPCIKPIKLMAYLVTMGSRPGDLVLDPFAGSGSTCIAAKMLGGRRFIGIEREADYCRIAEARLAAAPDPGEAENKDRENTNSGGREIRLKKNKSDGAYDWAGKTVNCCNGCEHNCRYCFARHREVHRFKRIAAEDWKSCQIRPHDVAKVHTNYGTTVMFPSSHDITPVNLEACLIVLGSLLRAGNRVLVVSKPHLEVIRAICDQFGDFRKAILFRFTITATDNELLAFWEPGAPTFEERCDALAYAFDAGFETSVSVEPMLDADNIDQLIAAILPRVGHSIWLGKMNYLNQVVVDGPDVTQELERIRASQTDERILDIYNRHKDNTAIHWKESIKDIVGLPRSEQPGIDE